MVGGCDVEWNVCDLPPEWGVCVCVRVSGCAGSQTGSLHSLPGHSPDMVLFND